MAIQSFEDYLTAHNTTLTNQGSFSSNYTAWLNTAVLGNSGVQTWLQTKLTSTQLAEFKAGQWQVDIQQWTCPSLVDG